MKQGQATGFVMVGPQPPNQPAFSAFWGGWFVIASRSEETVFSARSVVACLYQRDVRTFRAASAFVGQNLPEDFPGPAECFAAAAETLNLWREA